MKDGLKEINELGGTWGSLICNNQGEIIQSIIPPGLNKSVLENINRHLISMFIAANEPVKGISETVIHFEEKILFVQDLEKAFLVVICTPSVDISLLRMTVNVVKTNWDGDPKVQKQFQDNLVDRI